MVRQVEAERHLVEGPAPSTLLALDVGELAGHVVADPLAKAMELAREIAGKSPDAIRAGKRLLEATWHADPKTGLDLEQELQRGLIASANQIEAVKANFENRPPKFVDPA